MDEPLAARSRTGNSATYGTTLHGELGIGSNAQSKTRNGDGGMSAPGRAVDEVAPAADAEVRQYGLPDPAAPDPMEMADWHKDGLARDSGDVGVESAPRDVESNFAGCPKHAADDLGSPEPDFHDFVAELLLWQMGGSGKQRGLGRRTAARKIVSDIYSPPRVNTLIRELRPKHVMPGLPFDIMVTDPEDGMPCDFSIPEKRARARRKLREQKPYLSVGSPECKHLCTWHALNETKSKDFEAMRRANISAIVHLDFVASVYEGQAGGIFLPTQTPAACHAVEVS